MEAQAQAAVHEESTEEDDNENETERQLAMWAKDVDEERGRPDDFEARLLSWT